MNARKSEYLLEELLFRKKIWEQLFLKQLTLNKSKLGYKWGHLIMKKKKTLMCTCLHTSGALAEHFCSQHSRFYLVSRKPASIQKLQCPALTCTHIFFINCSSLWHQKLKRKRENSTSRYKEAVLCKVAFQTRHTFVIKTCLALLHHARDSP